MSTGSRIQQLRSVDKSTIPDGVNCYELRRGDDDSYPVAMEQSVR